MALSIDNRWVTIRVDADGARASLYAQASNGTKTATGVVNIELSKADAALLRRIIKDNEAVVDSAAMGNLMESVRIDENAAPPAGVTAIKLEGGLGMSGEATRRKS